MSTIHDKNYDLNLKEAIGNKYLLTNGYFGYRGTLDEDSKEERVAVNINGLFDLAEDCDLESVNAFNPLYTRIYINGKPVLRSDDVETIHKVDLNLKNGLFKRLTEFKLDNIMVTISSERFIDQKNLHMIYSRYKIFVDNPVKIVMLTGIDTEVWNKEGEHLKINGVDKTRNEIIISAETKNDKIPLVVGLVSDRDFRHKDRSDEDTNYKFEILMDPFHDYEIVKYACIMHSGDVDKKKMNQYLEEASENGYDELKRRNELYWEELWNDAKIDVINNYQANKQTQYSLFQLIQHRPYSDNVSIPMRGISGQYRNGAYHWLNEFFLFKFYLNTFPKAARHIVMNRINGLDGALALAKHFHREGALYPEFVSSLGMPIDYKFENKQMIIVSGLVVYTIYDYISRTQDESVLTEGGLKTVIECAKLFNSLAVLNETKTHYDFPEVSGIDRNHETVTNSVLTNMLIKNAYDVTLKMVTMVKTKDKKYWKKLFDKYGYDEDIKKLRKIRRKFYLKNPNVQNIAEQFDDYFNLEDVSIGEWKKLSRNEGFDKTKYQIIENAEVFAVSYLFPNEYSYTVKEANYEFYFNRLSSRRCLSKLLSLLMECELGNSRRAIKQYMNLTELEIEKTYRFEEGLDIFSCGASYVAMVYGFAGLRFQGLLVSNNLWLPNDIRRLEFYIKHIGDKGFVKVKRNIATIDWSE